ncbi:MAG: hypothetical protein WAM75_12340, partial [Xanthobacteraceae bacterium]
QPKPDRLQPSRPRVTTESRYTLIKRFIMAKVTTPRRQTAVQALQIVYKICFDRSFIQATRSLAARQTQP